MTERKRRSDLDAMKAVGIVFVIVFHTLNSVNVMPLESPVAVFVYVLMAVFGCQVGLFFFVNGALLLSRPFSLERHLHKTFNLLLLTIVWGLLLIGLWGVSNSDEFSWGGFRHCSGT